VAAPVAEPEPNYNPWRDLRDNWPEVTVAVVPMRGRLLGELDYPLILLRAGTTSAQRRCTLTHELVHLERGIYDCGPWQPREERFVHDEVARRLISTDQLVDAIRDAGAAHYLPAVAAALDVDTETLLIRLSLLTRAERTRLTDTGDDLWSVA
jgi:hypothetical protein